jgi:hypothetical protein
MHYHLAQINVGRTIAPVESPQLASFVSLLDAVNTEAERAPGFVWRLKDATSLRDDVDPLFLVSLSVWESVEALKQYAYSGGHLEAFRALSR